MIEQWVDAFRKSYSDGNQKEREEAEKQILEHISNFSPTFFENAFLILKDESIDHNVRIASSIYLSKFFFATQKKRMISIERFIQDPSRQEIITEFQETLTSLIFNDDILQRECIHILALLFYFNTEPLFEPVSQIFSSLGTDDNSKKNIPLFLYYDIINHPFIDSFVSNENIHQLLFQAFQSFVEIIQTPNIDDSDIDLKKNAAANIEITLSLLPKFICEFENIQMLLAAMPSSLTIADTFVFYTLHHIMYLLIANNYQFKDELFAIISQYVQNDLAMDGYDYLEVGLYFLDEMSGYERKLITTSPKKSASIPEEGNYITTKIFPMIYEQLTYFLLNGLNIGQNDNLYNYSKYILVNLINIEPYYICNLLFQSIDQHLESSEMNDHYIILCLISLINQLETGDVEFERFLHDFFQPKLSYLKNIITQSIGTPPMLFMALTATANLLYRLPSVVEMTTEPAIIFESFLEIIEINTINDSSIIVSYIDMISSLCNAFPSSSPTNPIKDKELFSRIVDLFLLLFQYPDFENHSEIIKKITRANRIFVQHISKDTNQINFFHELLVKLEESLSEENYFYQSLLCSMLYQLINFKKSILIAYFPDLNELLIHILENHDSPAFTYALPTFAISICYAPFEPALVEEFMNIVQGGLSTNDPSVILYTVISLLKVLEKHKDFIFPWTIPTYEMLCATLQEPDQNCREIAIPYMIRTISMIIYIDSTSQIDTYQEDAHQFISQQEEWMITMLTHFISDISYSFDYDDQIEFADRMFGSIAYSIGVYSQVYNSEGDKNKEITFFRTIYKPFAKAFAPLLNIKNDTCIDLFFMLNNLTKYISRINHGRICDRTIARKLHIIEESHIYPEEIRQIKNYLFGSESYEFLK